MRYYRWYYPSALTQLAAVAHAAGHDVSVYDAEICHERDPATRDRVVLMANQRVYHEQVDDLDHPIWQHFRQVLDRENPDVVGVSVLTCKLKSALNALAIVRDADPHIRTCVGGAHVTALPEKFAPNTNVDAVFTGWADVTFPQWLANGCPRGVFAADRDAIDLTRIPYSRREALLFPECYEPRDWSMIHTSRGCPGRCVFCSNGIMSGYRILPRPEESVRAELSELVETRQVTDVFPAEPTFTDRPDHYRAMARLFKEFALPWHADGRWATITPELLADYVDCGCYYLGVGLESGSARVLRHIRKGVTTGLVREKAAVLRDAGIRWQVSCVVGFPDETVDDMKRTRDLALEIQPTRVFVNALAPLPGTEVYSRIPGMTPELASRVSQLNPSHCFSEHMDLETFQHTFEDLLTTFDAYNRRAGGLRSR